MDKDSNPFPKKVVKYVLKTATRANGIVGWILDRDPMTFPVIQKLPNLDEKPRASCNKMRINPVMLLEDPKLMNLYYQEYHKLKLAKKVPNMAFAQFVEMRMKQDGLL